MKVSCVRAVGFLSIVVAAGASSAVALDAPQPPLHHTKSLHLSSTHRSAHRAVSHSAAAHPAGTVAHTARSASTQSTHSVTHATAQATVRAASVTHSGVQVRRASLTRHHYYERFTASSFVQGAIGVGDITPVKIRLCARQLLTRSAT
jgi:hypothetical protein